MAKKVRRVKKPGRRSNASVASRAQNAKPVETTRVDSGESFRQEYAYVLKDLRHILLLAAAMFVLLIVLNMILQTV